MIDWLRQNAEWAPLVVPAVLLFMYLFYEAVLEADR